MIITLFATSKSCVGVPTPIPTLPSPVTTSASVSVLSPLPVTPPAGDVLIRKYPPEAEPVDAPPAMIKSDPETSVPLASSLPTLPVTDSVVATDAALKLKVLVPSILDGVIAPS